VTFNADSLPSLSYLSDKRYLDTFEAAHSVVLAVFARRKKLGEELAPWYTEFLVEVRTCLRFAKAAKSLF
jgi:hypothetical protein